MEQNTNTTNPNAGKSLGIAGLIVGIVSVLFSVIPCLGMWAIIPAIVGIVISAISMSQAGKAGAPKGMAIGGLICSIIALLVAAYWIYAWAFIASTASGAIINELEKAGAMDSLNKALQQLKEITDTLNNR